MRRADTSRGLSLLESLFAGLLVSIAFFVILSIYPTALFGLRKGHDVVTAANLAQQILEQQRVTPFDQLQPVVAQQGVAQTIDGTVFTPTITIQSLAQDLKSAVVTVSWDGSGTGTKIETVTLQTEFYRFVND
jgi:Tfp pilus assembly protein PilV